MVEMDFNEIKTLCDIAINHPILRKAIEEVITQVVNKEGVLVEMYEEGGSKLELVKRYKELTGCSLMEAKSEIEHRFVWPNPNASQE